MPFTIAALVIVVTASAATGALTGKLSGAQVHRWGLGPKSITSFRLWGLFTANFLVDKPVAILSSVVMIALFIGWAELRYGLWAALITWFTSTWATVVLAALIWWPIALLGLARPLADVVVADVGSSAATWAALGLALGWPGAWPAVSMLAGLAALAFLTTLLVMKHTFTDLVHLVAFGYGALILAPLFTNWARPVHLAPAFITRLLVGLSGVSALLTALVVGGSAWPVMVVAGAALALLAIRPGPRVLTLALLAIGGVASVMATPNPATIVVFVGAAAFLIRPGLAESLSLRVR